MYIYIYTYDNTYIYICIDIHRAIYIPPEGALSVSNCNCLSNLSLEVSFIAVFIFKNSIMLSQVAFLSHRLASLTAAAIGADDDDDDVYFKKIATRGVTKFNLTQSCRPAKGISKRVNIQIIKIDRIAQ
jgi:hypothetical protein